MSAFSSFETEKRPPGRTLRLEPWVFADEWRGKPTETICVGLRLMSEADKTRARGESERAALELHPEGGDNCVDAFNDALIRHACALCLCDPNDVARPTEIMAMAEDEVAVALTTRGAKFIFEAIERYEIESSPLNPLAEETDVEELILALRSREISSVPSTARRMLRFALDEIAATP